MGRVHENATPSQVCEIVDFDSAMLEAWPPETRADLLREAQLLASVFAPEGSPGSLLEMAAQLSAGSRDQEMPRAHARRLSAALKRIARDG